MYNEIRLRAPINVYYVISGFIYVYYVISG